MHLNDLPDLLYDYLNRSSSIDITIPATIFSGFTSELDVELTVAHGLDEDLSNLLHVLSGFSISDGLLLIKNKLQDVIIEGGGSLNLINNENFDENYFSSLIQSISTLPLKFVCKNETKITFLTAFIKAWIERFYNFIII